MGPGELPYLAVVTVKSSYSPCLFSLLTVVMKLVERWIIGNVMKLLG